MCDTVNIVIVIFVNNHVACWGLSLTYLLVVTFAVTLLISYVTHQLLLRFNLFTLLVAGAVADINRIVAEGDSQNTLQALQVPSAGMRAVLPECADTYQTELVQRQTNSATKGNFTYCKNITRKEARGLRN